ncbi:hypothetical protein [Methylomonas sp. AM2-LC]|uniref:hypothetical protein n=1 Tax=Methylomonas sp. AM2-LC TaxID=3153301 RepID=UPI003265F1AC
MSVSALCLSMVMVQAWAEAPNYYECTNGKDISLKLRYLSRPNVPATTTLSLKLGKKTYKADETNIEAQSSVMGELNTITTQFIPDVEIHKVSFIIPTIDLGYNFAGQFISEVDFNSQLIQTTIATPFIAGPYIGVVNNSNYANLKCKAYLQLIP